MVRCFVGLLLGTFSAGACVSSGAENQNRILDCEQYKNSLKELTELHRKFTRLNEKVNLYKESLKNMERTGHFGVSPNLFSKGYIKKYVFGIKKSVNDEKNDIITKNKTFANQIENAEKEYATLKEIIAEKPTIEQEIYGKMVRKNSELRSNLFQLEEKLNEARQQEQVLKMEYLLEVDNNRRFFIPLSLGVRDTELLSKENDRLRELLEQRRLQLGEIQSRNDYLRGEIYRLENGLFEFK